MTWFNVYPSDGDGLTRRVTTQVDLRTVALSDWTDDELGFRLAALYPYVDGNGLPGVTQEIRDEIQALMAEIKNRGYDPISNLLYNERVTGWGWLPGFTKIRRKK